MATLSPPQPADRTPDLDAFEHHWQDEADAALPLDAAEMLLTDGTEEIAGAANSLGAASERLSKLVGGLKI